MKKQAKIGFFHLFMHGGHHAENKDHSNARDHNQMH